MIEDINISKVEIGKKVIEDYVNYEQTLKDKNERIAMLKLELRTSISAPVSKYGDSVSGHSELNVIERTAAKRAYLKNRIAIEEICCDIERRQHEATQQIIDKMSTTDKKLLLYRFVTRLPWLTIAKKLGKSERWARDNVKRLCRQVGNECIIMSKNNT